jgi:glycosyltransferase involved in cell wall biosynthesis
MSPGGPESGDRFQARLDLGPNVGAPARLEDVVDNYLDPSWYVRHYPDLANARVSAREHYLNRGWRERRQPNPYFDPDHYRAQLPQALRSDEPELLDYATRGWLAGLNPSPRFDVAHYATTHQDVLVAGLEPLAHYIRFGRAEGRVIEDAEAANTAKSVMRPGSTPSLLAEQHLKSIVTGPGRTPVSASFDPMQMRIDWIIPDFAPGAGGHSAIFKAAYWLEQRGHNVSIWLDYPSGRTEATATYQEILRDFQSLRGPVRILEAKDVISTDVLLATDRWTVWSALKHGDAKLFGYFVQDFEPYFYPLGAEYFLAAHTYDQGLFCICSSKWLATKMQEHGADTIDFVYPADEENYHPAPTQRNESDDPLIALYARPATGRRAVELALLGLIRLWERGTRFRVAMFGQDLDPNSRWPFPVELLGVLNEAELGDLFRRADVGVALSSTNYSICSVEMMACGLPIVDLETEATLATFPDGTATLAAPNPAGVADALESLLRDDERRKAQSDAAREWAIRSSWVDIAARMETAFQERISMAGYSERRSVSTARRQPKVTVAIPTLNGATHLDEVLVAIENQVTPFEVHVLVVDSGSTDDTLEIVARYPKVRLHQIPKREFNHGATRNLAVELADSDYVAFLTQDAEPSTAGWLANLVNPLIAVPGAAGAFGRHLPRQDANPFTVRDLQAHFDLYKVAPLIVNADTDRERFARRDPDWLRFLRYYSDNNSCLSTRAWERNPLPCVNFGEDQVWAWNCVLAGYSKIYVDRAPVYHSHDYRPTEAAARARTEAAFFRLVFNDHIAPNNESEADDRVRWMFARDVAFAVSQSLPLPLLRQQLSLNAAVVAGQLLSIEDAEVPY